MQNKEQDPPGHMGDAVIIRNTVVGLKAVTDTHQQQQNKKLNQRRLANHSHHRNIIRSTSFHRLGDFPEV